MKKETKLPEGVTPEMVGKWKEEYGANNVKLAHLVDGDGNPRKTIVVRVPDRVTLGEQEKYSYTAPQRAREILVKGCVLSHKDEVLADNQLYYSAYAALIELSPLAKATVEDL
ncbi:hypothetical protein FACS1894169_01050 [Bacteroidia bacterium]|nr:hypothetical protein FACS1894169_01050 [Bacteroidia bacterium]